MPSPAEPVDLRRESSVDENLVLSGRGEEGTIKWPDASCCITAPARSMSCISLLAAEMEVDGERRSNSSIVGLPAQLPTGEDIMGMDGLGRGDSMLGIKEGGSGRSSNVQSGCDNCEGMGKPAGTVDTRTGKDTVLMTDCEPKNGHKVADGVEDEVSFPWVLPDNGNDTTTS